jgi:hypothetical protein
VTRAAGERRRILHRQISGSARLSLSPASGEKRASDGRFIHHQYCRSPGGSYDFAMGTRRRWPLWAVALVVAAACAGSASIATARSTCRLTFSYVGSTAGTGDVFARFDVVDAGRGSCHRPLSASDLSPLCSSAAANEHGLWWARRSTRTEGGCPGHWSVRFLPRRFLVRA